MAFSDPALSLLFPQTTFSVGLGVGGSSIGGGFLLLHSLHWQLLCPHASNLCHLLRDRPHRHRPAPHAWLHRRQEVHGGLWLCLCHCRHIILCRCHSLQCVVRIIRIVSPAYAFGPVVAGHLVENFGFTTLNVVVGVISLIYAPIVFYLKDMHKSAKTEPMQGPG